jgi:hypothetical protein
MREVAPEAACFLSVGNHELLISDLSPTFGETFYTFHLLEQDILLKCYLLRGNVSKITIHMQIRISLIKEN